MEINHTNSVAHLFIQTAKSVRSDAERELSELGLHVGQNRLLMELYEQNCRRPSDMADRMDVDPSVISKMLGRMENQKLVERQADQDDGRVTRVYLTDKGRALQEPVENFQRRLEERLVEDFSTEEELLFRRMLADIHENFS